MNRKEAETVGRYLLLWKLDWTKIPVSPQERGAGFNGLMEEVKEDIRKGLITDWVICRRTQRLCSR